MANYAYLKIKTSQSGDIKGDVKIKGLEDFIEVAEVDYKVEAPKDQLSGGARSQRIHYPISIVAKLDHPGIPLLLQALTRNEKIVSAELRFYRPDAETGKNLNHTTIKFSGGGFASFQLQHPNAFTQSDSSLTNSSPTIPTFIKFSCTFDSINVDNLVAKTSYAETWTDTGGGRA